MRRVRLNAVNNFVNIWFKFCCRQPQNRTEIVIGQVRSQLILVHVHYRKRLFTQVCAAEFGQQLASQVFDTYYVLELRVKMLFCWNDDFSSGEHWRSITSSWQRSGTDSTSHVNGSRMKLNKSLCSLKASNRSENSFSNVSQLQWYLLKSHWYSFWKSEQVGKWQRFPDCRFEEKSLSFNVKDCSSWYISKMKWSLPWRHWLNLFKWSVMSVRNAKSANHCLSENKAVSLPLSVRNSQISFRNSTKRFNTFPRLSHLTSVWYGMSRYSASISSRNDLNCPWLSPLARMKFTEVKTNFMTLSNFNIRAQRASWWIKQWYRWTLSVGIPSPCRCDSKWATNPDAFPVIAGAPSVVALAHFVAV